MEGAQDGDVVELGWVQETDLPEEWKRLFDLVGPGVLAAGSDVEESTAAGCESVVSDHRGDFLVLWTDLVVQAGVVGRALGWIVGVEADELFDQAAWSLLPVDLLEVVDDVLVCGDVQLVDEGEERAFVDHVADDEWDLRDFALGSQFGWVVDEVFAVGARVPGDECCGVGKEVGLALDGGVYLLVWSSLGTGKLVAGVAAVDSLHQSVEDGLSVVVVEHLWDLW